MPTRAVHRLVSFFGFGPPARPTRRPRPAAGGGAGEPSAPHRSAPHPSQAYLSSMAHAWLESLPPAVVPRQMAASYPRLVNRLALCWRDAALAGMLLDELLVDRRGGRRGFPPAVAAELLRLREWQALRPDAHTAERGDGWDSRSMATSDRDSRFDRDSVLSRF